MICTETHLQPWEPCIVCSGLSGASKPKLGLAAYSVKAAVFWGLGVKVVCLNVSPAWYGGSYYNPSPCEAKAGGLPWVWDQFELQNEETVSKWNHFIPFFFSNVKFFYQRIWNLSSNLFLHLVIIMYSFLIWVYLYWIYSERFFLKCGCRHCSE